MTLTKNIDLLTEYFSKILENVPREIVLLSILSKLSQAAMLNRLQVQDANVTTYANLYTLVFAPSGIGKDKTSKVIDKELLPSFYAAFNKMFTEFRENEREKLEKEALELYPSSPAERERYINNSSVRELATTISDATPEGLTALRLALQKAEFGGTMVQISEFADFILHSSTARDQLISLLVEIYDDGSSNSKVIKAERHLTAVKNVPSTVSAWTSPQGLLDGVGKDKLKSFFDRGLARRAMVCFVEKPLPNKGLMDKQVWAKERANRAFVYSEQTKVKDIFYSFLKKVVSKNIVTLTEQSAYDLYVYKYNNENKALQLQDACTDGQLAEIRSRFWRAFKLSGLISAIEDNGSGQVAPEHLACSIAIVDYFGEQFQKFYDAKPIDDIEKLFKFFKKNLGKKITKKDIRKENFVHSNRFRSWWEELEPELIEYAASKQLFLNKIKGEKNSIYYILDKNKANEQLISEAFE